MKKKFAKILLMVFLILVLFFSFLAGAALVSLNIETNHDMYELSSTHEMVASYDSHNGSDWGHNQSKLASINDVIFTFHFDNSNLANGNSSDTNPYYSYFIMIIDGEETEFGSGTCNRPGNVLADRINNKVYYILSEPAGPAFAGGEDYTSAAQTVMYEYDFDSVSNTLTLFEKHIVTPISSDGKIRQGVSMDENGNIAIAYGTYSGQMIIYTYDYAQRIFQEYTYQSNDDGDSLMYVNVAMKDLDHVYLLAEQDTSRDNQTFYQYVMFFAMEEGSWMSAMVVDYRDSTYAEDNEAIVINSDIDIHNDTVYMAASSKIAHEVTIRTYDSDSSELHNISSTFLPKGTSNVKFLVIDNELYISTMSFTWQAFLPTFSIYDISSQKIVYRLNQVINNRYFYIDISEDNNVALLLYNNKKGTLYTLNQTVE